jgi:hypothetical protein
MYRGWITMMQFATSNVSERECRPGMKEGLIIGFQLRRIDFVPAAIIILAHSLLVTVDPEHRQNTDTSLVIRQRRSPGKQLLKPHADRLHSTKTTEKEPEV